MLDWINAALALLTQFTGARGGGENNFVVYGIAALFYAVLLAVARANYRKSPQPREYFLRWGFSLGLGRELFMLAMALFYAQGLMGAVTLAKVFPPLEHFVRDSAMIFLAGGYLRFFIDTPALPSRYLRASLAATLLLYLSIFWWWAGYIGMHPTARFEEVWGEWLFRTNASFWLLLATYLIYTQSSLHTHKTVSLALLLFAAYEFLKLPDIALHEVHEAVFTPIRRSFYLTGIFMLGYAYLQEMNATRGTLESQRDAARHQFDHLVTNIPVGVYLLHTRPTGELDFRYVSPRFCAMLGLSAEELYRAPELSFTPFHPDDLEDFKRMNQAAIVSQAPFRWQGRIRVEGEERWLLVESHPEPQENGDCLWDGLVTDITLQKQVELNVVLHKLVVDTALEGYWRFGMDGRLLEVNRAYANLVGYSQEELVGRYIYDFSVERPTPATVVQRIQQIAHGKGFDHFETQHRHKDGHIVYLETSNTYLPEANCIFSFLHDISSRKQAEQLLRLHDAAIETTHDGFWVVDETGHLITVNRAYTNMLGYEMAELQGAHISMVEAQETEVEEVRQHMAVIFERGWDVFETSHRHKDGREVEFEVSATFIPESRQIVAFFRDISQRKLAERELRIAATAFETHEAIMITDANAIILRVNHAFQRITGYGSEEVLGKSPRILSSGRHNREFYAEMWRALLDVGSWTGEIWDKRKNGQIYPKWLTITAAKNFAGETSEYVCIFSDITDRKTAEEEIHSLAYYDLLTKLPNRRLLIDRIRQAQSVSVRSGQQAALLFIDMDRFKTLNDTLGHDYGDLFLIEIAQRLRRCVRDVDTVARIGGDEFVLSIGEIGLDAVEASYVAMMKAEEVRSTLSEPYQLGVHEHHSSPSIGVCVFRGKDDVIETLLKQADIAMYQAKESGRNAARIFDLEMQQAVDLRAAIELDLRNAIQNGQLCLHYQIQLDSDFQPLGAEALIRWTHPVRGMVSPAQFIPIAEESPLILDIGHWVLEAACKQLDRWRRSEQTRNLILAVNVSARQFERQNFVDGLVTLLRVHHVNPNLLKLELTESIVLSDVVGVITKMHALKALGVRLSLDDFGTGYSSLSYLKRLPLDQIKIDQSFVRDLMTDISDAIMVQTIINLARNFQLNVIAEGVETEAQLKFLKENGCQAYQGYLFSKPVPIDEFETLLDRYTQGR